MKVRTLLITSFLLLITFELINADDQTKKNLSQNPNKFMQENKNEFRKLTDVDIIAYSTCKELLKPSTAFTVVLMLYMVIIIVGAILVLVLLRKELSE